jgi:hypothetical protein
MYWDRRLYAVITRADHSYTLTLALGAADTQQDTQPRSILQPVVAIGTQESAPDDFSP